MSEPTNTTIPPTLFLSDDDVASLADWAAAVAALADAYARPVSDAMVPPRSMARGDGHRLRSLTAVSPSGGHLGCKLIAASTRARRASYLISLFDQDTTALAALIDGNRVTGLRTAATATLAADLLAPLRPLRVAVIGSGFEARGALDCLRTVRKVQSVRVYSPTPASRERFADSFRPDLDITAVGSAEEAVREADVVLCAARSRDESPVLRGAWLPAGCTVVSLGRRCRSSARWTRKRWRAPRIVADMPDEVEHDTGDAIAATRAGVHLPDKLVSLAALAAGAVTPRRNERDIVVYKSVGSALQDVVIAEMLLALARERAVGTPLAASIAPVSK